jgi:spermidine synthase
MSVGLNTRWIVFSILALGIAEILTQLVVIREFLAVFYGNELVIGILLANWLLISGIGSYVGRHVVRIVNKERLVILLHIVIALLLPIYLVMIRNLYNFVFIRGELVGAAQVFIAAFVILLPVCFITGFSLPLFSLLYSRKKRPLQIGKVYYLDSLSNIIGGVLFSFILVHYLNAFQVAMIVLILNLVAAIIISVKLHEHVLGPVSLVLLAIGLAVFGLYDLNLITTQQQYSMQEVALAEESKFGRFVVTRTGGQYNFYDNSVPVFSTGDARSAEEKVHYTLLQHLSPERVLLLSGGFSGTTNEALKYRPEFLDYVEMNPLLITSGKRFTDSLESRKIGIYWMDPRIFVKESGRKYDAVIIDMPDPSTAQSNRFYTVEFFSDVRRILRPNGVVGLSISSGENYMSKETRQLNAAVYNSLLMNFRKILIVPGDTAYLVASNADLAYEYYDNITIPAVYVNNDYLEDKITAERVDNAYAALEGHDMVNRDFRPLAYYYHLQYWLSQFSTSYTIFVVIALLFLVAVLWRINALTFAVLNAGFAGISLELVLLFSFQILYGFVYHKLGILITSFMLGLALGAWYMNKRLPAVKKKTLSNISAYIAVFSVLLPLLLLYMRSVSSGLLLSAMTNIIFPLLAIMIGALVGALFPAAAKLHFRNPSRTASTLYFYDYAGACIGAILVSVLLIPLLGIFNVCFIIAGVSVIAAVVNRK